MKEVMVNLNLTADIIEYLNFTEAILNISKSDINDTIKIQVTNQKHRDK